MPGQCRIYYINLCYEAYFGTAMEVAAKSPSEACGFAMAHADDSSWKDTLASSSYWIESVDYAWDVVPEEYSAAAIRCGGVELVAYRLREALTSLVRACERDPKTLAEIGSDVEQAKAVLTDIRI